VLLSFFVLTLILDTRPLKNSSELHNFNNSNNRNNVYSYQYYFANRLHHQEVGGYQLLQHDESEQRNAGQKTASDVCAGNLKGDRYGALSKRLHRSRKAKLLVVAK
jgi:hypothetical protein